MSDSIRTQIKNAIGAALSGEAAPAVLERALTGPVGEATLPLYVLQLVNEGIASPQLGADTRTLSLRLICAVSADDNLDDATEPLINWAEDKIGNDATLRSLTTNVTLSGIAWQYDTGDENFTGAVMEYELTYDSQPHEPTTPVVYDEMGV